MVVEVQKWIQCRRRSRGGATGAVELLVVSGPEGQKPLLMKQVGTNGIAVAS